MAPRKKSVLPTATETPIFSSAQRNKAGVKKPSKTAKQAQQPTVAQSPVRLPPARPLSPFHYDEYEAPPSPPPPPSFTPKSPRKKNTKPIIPFDKVTTIPMSQLRAQQADRSAILRKGSSLIPRDPAVHIYNFHNAWRKHLFNRDMDPALRFAAPELRTMLGLSPKWKDPTKTKVPKKKTPFGEGFMALYKGGEDEEK
ncbi:uncharacterized protein J4E87_011035 [Alternaria ethzedia]|uniref:uncharacterized protein n=1 Tax=Alternaria ethzedia TaxID=181014 RepID=UPI0020C428B9|nr:uncharacterized protein J4E87_011035 [Alternaria ethzedia]KAI4609587.1 hypothetical protein J4E87_011035 [Alternaria ethzedia]